MIYLDNAATTKPSKSTLLQIRKWLGEEYFNPSALYYPAVEAKNRIEAVRNTIAEKLHCKPNEIFFTSGATESNNWAIHCGRKNKKGNVVVSEGEHPSMYEPAVELKGQGVDVRVVPLRESGEIDREKLLNAVDENTTFVSVMNVSNETGVINPIGELARLVKQKNPKALFHSDGVQAFCKIPINLSSGAVDLYSISAHKIGGLKGCGALYVKGGNFSPLMLGGGQERRLRSGTENVPGILSFGTALSDLNGDGVRKLYDYSVKFLSEIDDVKINGAKDIASGYIVSVGIKGVKAEVLQHMMSDDGILIGLGSACSSKSKGNRILASMKVDKTFIEGNIRLSFSPANTLQELETALERLKENIATLRRKIHG